AGLAVGLLTGDTALIGAGMNDRLHEPYRARLFTHLDAVKDAARGAGAIGACLSGAGPTVLSLVARERVAEVIAAVKAEVRALGVPGRVIELAPSAVGATIVPEFASPR
ncbi:MAG TPA: hypothetical protein VNP95_14215, partial [Thermomicrobiales bacterium]|nr:hypothetical protein [Thermomicrobiales bacterium]